MWRTPGCPIVMRKKKKERLMGVSRQYAFTQALQRCNKSVRYIKPSFTTNLFRTGPQYHVLFTIFFFFFVYGNVSRGTAGRILRGFVVYLAPRLRYSSPSSFFPRRRRNKLNIKNVVRNPAAPYTRLHYWSRLLNAKTLACKHRWSAQPNGQQRNNGTVIVLPPSWWMI